MQNPQDISKLENVSALKNLIDLQIANNKISTIGDSLNGNDNLQTLNVSGNQLVSFQDVLSVVNLPKLTTLILSDPNFEENPICWLCNYQTHVIFHLPQLRWLDTLEITEESRRIINATVLKKRMYYNMRVQTIKRNFNFLMKTYDVFHNRERERLEANLKILLSHLKFIRRRQDDATFLTTISLELPPNANFQNERATLEEIRNEIEKHVEKYSQKLAALKHARERVCEVALLQTDFAIRKLILELETGGNLRFEDEVLDDGCVTSDCSSIIGQFAARGAKCVGPVGRQYRMGLSESENAVRFQIHRLTRVHNRWLKKKCELAQPAKPTEPAHTFYLCYEGPSLIPTSTSAPHHTRTSLPLSESDILKISEHGLTRDDHATSSSPTSLHNQLILTNFFEYGAGRDDGSSSRSSTPWLKRAIVVRAQGMKLGQVPDQKVLLQASSAHYPNYDGIYTSTTSSLTPGDECQIHLPFVCDRIVPEYIVEYSVATESALGWEHPLSSMFPFESVAIDCAVSSVVGQHDMPKIFLQAMESISKAPPESTLPQDLEKRYPLLKRIEQGHGLAPPGSVLESLLHRPASSITHLNLTKYRTSHPFDTTTSSAHSSSQTTTTVPAFFPDTSVLQNLRTLVLPFNNLTTQDLDTFLASSPQHPHALETLDISFNKLTSIPESIR
ncbi:Leucine-rich repeat-containing protein 9, partial [Quaeritorhiza haematococci]